MKRILAILAATGVALLALTGPTEAAPAKMICVVSSPLSAAQLNEPNNGSWSVEVFNAAPNVTYLGKLQWAGDPSNGGHPNLGVTTDAAGYGIASAQRYWAPDGFLPGYFAFFDPENPISGFVAVPGDFSVQVGPETTTGEHLGKANCAGEVLP